MIILDGIVLNGSLQWSERFASFSVRQSVKTTLGGRAVVNAAPLTGGREITLVASEETGWLTGEMLSALLQRAATPGLVMSLTFHDELVHVPVVFRHNDAPAVDFSPLTPKKQMEGTDQFIGSIKLLSL